jgi:hypothetical protein
VTRGICPFAVWRPTKNHDYNGPNENHPLVFVDHIMGGWKSTMDGPWLDASGISSHFGFGRDGSISQYVNIFDASYGNGIVGQSPRGDRRGIDLYDRSNPRLAQIEREAKANWHTVELSTGPKWTMSIGGANAWNIRSITSEHEGLNGGTPWTPEMVAADVAVKRWCNEELAREGYPTIPYDYNGIIGHNDIDHIDRAGCPGSGRPLALIVDLLNGGGVMPQDNDQILALLALAHFIRNGWNLADLSPQDKAAIKAAAERVPA